MSVFLFRPKVADLVFQVYSRPLHPELFDVLAVRRIERGDYQLTAQITRSGHVVCWSDGAAVVTELVELGQPLAEQRRLLSYKLRGEHAGALQPAASVGYQMNFQVETLPPEIFLHVHDEILADGGKRGLLHNFQPNHRLAIAPLSYIAIETRARCVFLSSFHTFPEENTVIKSQTLIEARPK